MGLVGPPSLALPLAFSGVAGYLSGRLFFTWSQSKLLDPVDLSNLSDFSGRASGGCRLQLGSWRLDDGFDLELLLTRHV